jgi:hypothetical protein
VFNRNESAEADKGSAKPALGPMLKSRVREVIFSTDNLFKENSKPVPYC